jgi:hypothetical protein
MYKLLLSFLLPVSLMACKCLVSYPVCNEVAASDLIFIGTVESIEPAFLDPWNPSRLSLLPTAEIMRLRQEETPASLARLKQIYSQLYPNMQDHYKTLLEAAKTHAELESVVREIGAEGIQVRIRVKKYFKRSEDDDADSKDDDKKDDVNKKDNDDKQDDDRKEKKEEVVTVWTPADDCGYNFQKGETYLVYADDDEETESIETSICTRTKRLTDAGPDLAYLYFRENGGDASTRLEGFVTDEPSQDLSRFANAVHSPVPGVILELKTDGNSRYAKTGPDGRFVFDGLGEGRYSLTPFGADYPTQVVQLAEPTQFSAGKNSCAREILTVPKVDPKRTLAN